MKPTVAFIVVPGYGEQMHSKTPDVLHRICGRTLVEHVADAVKDECDQTALVLPQEDGKKLAEQWKDQLGAFSCFAEPSQDAEMTALLKKIKAQDGCVLFAQGNMPLVRQETYQRLADCVAAGECEAAVLRLSEKEAAEDGGSVVGCVKAGALCRALEITHGQWGRVDRALWDAGCAVRLVEAQEACECLRVTSRASLAVAGEAMRRRINGRLMENGVTMIDPERVYIDADVTVGCDTIVYPGCILENGTHIGEGCTLYANCRLNHARIGNRVTIESSVILDAAVSDGTTVGPYAYLRPNTEVGEGCRIGDFVEIKNSHIGNGTKVSHLTYVGDSDLGEHINLGCGVVFVNYDGKKKQRSVVGDHAFIGCNVNLVAPVHVGQEAYIAAGSTVTCDVPEGAMLVAREREVVKEGWVEKRKAQGKL